MLSSKLATVLLGPVLLCQGRSVRRRVPRLPEPPGAREGVAGRGPALRILITGDSAAAGVGAPHQDQALLGQLVSRLSRLHRVEWTLDALTGATTASTTARLRRLDPCRYDVAVTSLGVNDVTSGVRRSRWRGQQAELRSLLRERFAASRIVVSGLPPVDGFPSLPQPLRWYLGSRARQFSRDLEKDVTAEPGCRFVDLRFAEDTGLMAADGFHPGPAIYAGWAQRVADLVLSGHGRLARAAPLREERRHPSEPTRSSHGR